MMKPYDRARGNAWRLLPVALVAAFVLLPAAPKSVAAASTDGPAAGMPIVTCRAGEELSLPISSSVEDDGWIRLDYYMDGIYGYEELPPTGFAPSSAPEALLLRHHLPVRPAASDISSWTSLVSRLSWTRSRGLCKDPINSYLTSQMYNQIWGGVEVRAQSAYGFRGVAGTVKQPAKIKGAWCGAGATMSSFVGIGGDNNSLQDFFQTGTSTWDSVSPNAWWQAKINGQYLNAVDYAFPDKILAGDPMFEMVTYTDVDRTMEFLVWDQRSGDIGYHFLNLSGLLPPIGTIPDVSAEWIDEKRAGSPPLLNYGATHWSTMQVQRSTSYPTWTNAYPEPTKWNISISANGGSSGLESKTTGISSSNTMQNTWLAC